ncbi:hypothetical protein KAR28_02680 [Candidatus Parcubacteria bacterium]|nr:hypothetical protein [Candidatus Parcubacteria bacterium]
MFKKLTMVVAIVFMFAFTLTPALAGDMTMVMNDNEGAAANLVGAEANTGGNYAGGSYAGDGGDGGDMKNSGTDIEDSSTGAGGNGGSSGEGGAVITGDADAKAAGVNLVNTNYTEVDDCACEDEEEENGAVDSQLDGPGPGPGPGMCCGDKVIVRNHNRHLGENMVGARANTGENMADGSEAGYGGEGGEMKNKDGEDIERSHTGAGGTGGNSGVGGYVETGRSDSRALGVNILGTNITRIRR